MLWPTLALRTTEEHNRTDKCLNNTFNNVLNITGERWAAAKKQNTDVHTDIQTHTHKVVHLHTNTYPINDPFRDNPGEPVTER